jgi:hypothetical protein
MYSLPPVRYDGLIDRDIMIPRFFLKWIEASYQGVLYTAFVRLSLCNKNNSYCQTPQVSRTVNIWCSLFMTYLTIEDRPGDRCLQTKVRQTLIWDPHSICLKAGLYMHTAHYHCTDSYFKHRVLPQPLPLSSYFILVALFCLIASYQKILQYWMKYELQNRCLGQLIIKHLDPVTNIIIIIIKSRVHCLTPQSILKGNMYQF